MRSYISVIRPGEPIDDRVSLFLAGPTPRSPEVVSWRPAAIQGLARMWDEPGPLVVFNPEPFGPPEDLDEQYGWEMDARRAATVIAYWIPRDLKTMPGFTTNTEFGYDVAKERRVVLGCPPDCPDARKNRYLIYLAQDPDPERDPDYEVPVCETLDDTMATALRFVHGAERSA